MVFAGHRFIGVCVCVTEYAAEAEAVETQSHVGGRAGREQQSVVMQKPSRSVAAVHARRIISEALPLHRPASNGFNVQQSGTQ